MIVDGKKIANEIMLELKEEVSSLEGSPKLVFILMGSHAPSQAYVNMKQESCNFLEIQSEVITLNSDIQQRELLQIIEKLNQDPSVHGILVQMPMAKHIDIQKIFAAIHPDKDVDGFHPLNQGKLALDDPTGFVPCTPLGIRTLLQRLHFPLQGKHVAIIGRSMLVGKPLANLLLQKSSNATVSVIHSQSKDFEMILLHADIVVACLGIPKFVKSFMIQKEAFVIDVGIHKMENRVVGDVDFEEVKEKAKYITPVPGGVGPMTIAMLMQNTIKAFKRSS